MILLSHVIDHYQKELEKTHGHEMLLSHHQALRAMRRCRREGIHHMRLECKPCATRFRVPHSCGHRSCPHCQHHDSQQWISRQTAKLLPVTYFMITFTLPAQLRNTFWQHQKPLYDPLIKVAWQTADGFALRDPNLTGRIGAHSVLHTHNRRLDYHPHVHMIVPAGVVDEKRGYWRQKAENDLFPALNLAKVFRAKLLAGIKALGLTVKEALPEEWVVHCKAVGRGDRALIDLGRYLYRGVISEKTILGDCQGDHHLSNQRERRSGGDPKPPRSGVPLALAAPCLAQTLQACPRLWPAARQCQASDPAPTTCAQRQIALGRTA